MTEPLEKFIPEKHRVPREDPAPKRTQRPLDQLTQTVNDLSIDARTHVTELRDLLDDILVSLKREDERLKNDIEDHGRWCQSVIDNKKVIADAVAPLRNNKLLTARLTTVSAAANLLDSKKNGGAAV